MRFERYELDLKDLAGSWRRVFMSPALGAPSVYVIWVGSGLYVGTTDRGLKRNVEGFFAPGKGRYSWASGLSDHTATTLHFLEASSPAGLEEHLIASLPEAFSPPVFVLNGLPGKMSTSPAVLADASFVLRRISYEFGLVLVG